MSERQPTFTPPPERRRGDDYSDAPGYTGTPAPLRRAAAKMNAVAVTLVQYSTSMFIFVGVGCIVWALGDSFLHHVIGHWPEQPEVAALRKLEKVHEETLQELERVRNAWFECINDNDGDATAEEAR